MSGGSSANLSTSANTYMSLFLILSNATESNVQSAIPLTGAITNMNVRITVPASTGDTYAFTIRSGGADTTVACSISGGTATTCNSGVTCANLTAGNLMSVEADPDSDPDAAQARVTAVFHPGVTCADLGL